jgi:rare lipoprotein A
LNRTRGISLLSVLLLLSACAPAPKYVTGRNGPRTSGGSTTATPRPVTPDRPPPRSSAGRVPSGPERWGDHYLRGMASYYGQEFHGRKTANGEIFNMYKLSAAHRTLPLGTTVRVWNLENGRNVVLRVNDRGPFIEGRILDLSYAAALELEMVSQGVAPVQIEILELPPQPWW